MSTTNDANPHYSSLPVDPGTISTPHVPEPEPAPSTMSAEEDRAIRHVTFWRDGFTIEGGALMRYDDPKNQPILVEINSGRAPQSLFNIQPGQLVELRVDNQLEKEYQLKERPQTGTEKSSTSKNPPSPPRRCCVTF